MHKVITIIGILSVFFLLNSNVGFAQSSEGKVYWMMTVEVPIGKLAEFHAFNAQELGTITEKYGYKPVATWQTIVGDIEEVISIAEFENMAAYHKSRVALLGSEEWKAASIKFDALVKNVKTRFLSATPYSKMK